MSHAGASKRQKELARLERRKNKDSEREQRKVQKEARPERLPGQEDPDIAGIVPGPQPLPEGF